MFQKTSICCLNLTVISLFCPDKSLGYFTAAGSYPAGRYKQLHQQQLLIVTTDKKTPGRSPINKYRVLWEALSTLQHFSTFARHLKGNNRSLQVKIKKKNIFIYMARSTTYFLIYITKRI